MGQRSYTATYCSDVVKLDKELGASAAAQQLQILANTLYTWISRAKKRGLPMSEILSDPQASLNLAKRVKELERENKALRCVYTAGFLTIEDMRTGKNKYLLLGLLLWSSGRQTDSTDVHSTIAKEGMHE